MKKILFLMLIVCISLPAFSQSLVIEYKCGETNTNSNQLKPHLNLKNVGTDAISLDELTIRYFYEKEGTAPESVAVDHAAIGNSNVIPSLFEGYVEIGFTASAGTLIGGGNTGEIQLRINKSDWSAYDQSNDFSFDGTKTDFAEWERIAVLDSNGNLIYGIMPGDPMSPTPSPIITQGPAEPTPSPTPVDDTCVTCGSVISGTILDQGNNPIPGSTVTYRGTEILTTTTDAAGYYEFSTIIQAGGGCPDLYYYLDVSAPGYRPMTWRNDYLCGNWTYNLALSSVDHAPGNLWFAQGPVTVNAGETFTLDVRANTGNQIIAQYGIDLSYHAGVIDYLGYSTSDGGFVDENNEDALAGQAAVSGTYGEIGPGEDVQVVALTFIALGGTHATIDLNVNNLLDPYLEQVGMQRGDSIDITINGGISPGPTANVTPVPTKAPITEQPLPSPIGNFTWWRHVQVNDAETGTDPIAGAIILANALTRNGSITDETGKSTIEVNAHDTGRVSLSVSAPGYLSYQEDLPGLPVLADLSINLEPDGTPTPGPGGYTLTINFTGNGYVSVNPPGETVYSAFAPHTFVYDPGEIVALTAIAPTPDPCGIGCPRWSFTGWEGDPIEDDSTIVMDRDKSITAVFFLPTYVPTMEPTPVPADPTPGPGVVRFNPVNATRTLINLEFINSGFPNDPVLFPSLIIGDFTITNEIHAHTGSMKLASYGFDISFDNDVVIVNTEEGDNGVSPGADGFLTSADTGTPGLLRVSGYDASGTGPGADLHLLTIHWLAQTYNGTTPLTLSIDALDDVNGNVIGVPAGENGSITIKTITCVIGDVNSDGEVDIVDALLTAQFYVGLNPLNFHINCGDVDCDGDVDIIDALLVAQFYVGLLPDLTC